MAATVDLPAWIALFIGLYALSASIGEWRQPGFWASMLADFERSPALRFLTGLTVLFFGAAIYLASPWRPGDWLAVTVTVLGVGMAIEGALILALGDRFLGFARVLLGRATKTWAAFSALLGAAFIAVALIRL